MGPETPTPHFPPLESGVGTGGEMGVHALQAPEAGWTRWRPSHRSFLCSGPSAEPCGVPPPATLGRHRQAPNSTTDDSERQTDRQTERGWVTALRSGKSSCSSGGSCWTHSCH